MRSTHSEGASTPGATTVNLIEVGQLAKDGLVTQRDIDHAVMSEGAHGSKASGLLTTALSTSGDEETSVLAPVATGGPDSTGGIPESLPLSREVTIAGGDTEQNTVILRELLGSDGRVLGLGRGVHLGQNLLRKSLGNPAGVVSGDEPKAINGEHTGRCRPGHQQPQYPSSQPRPSSGCGRRASTVR